MKQEFGQAQCSAMRLSKDGFVNGGHGNEYSGYSAKRHEMKTKPRFAATIATVLPLTVVS